MTEAIIITLIIVGGLVALAWIALHFGYKAWSAERESAEPSYSVTIAGGEITPATLSHLSDETVAHIANGERKFNVGTL